MTTQFRRTISRQELTIEVLERLSGPGPVTEAIKDTLGPIKEHSGCGLVDVCLRQPVGLPCLEVTELHSRCVQAMDDLCVIAPASQGHGDGENDPALDRMLGNVVCGRFDPTDPLFTRSGSFWINNVSEVWGPVTQRDQQAETCKRRHTDGWESIALIPIRDGQNTLGVLRLADRGRDRFSLEVMEFYEWLGRAIGMAIGRLEAETALARRLEFEKTISRISSRFVGVCDIDEAIHASLADAARLSGASRAYLFQFREDGHTMDNTHEWCDQGVEPQIDSLQGLRSEEFPWLVSELRKREAIHIQDVSQMPAEAKAEKVVMETRGVKSLLVLPVHAKEEASGFIGFDNAGETGRWGDEELAILQTLAEIIGSALEREQAQNEILEHGRRAETLRRVSQAVASSLDMKSIADTALEAVLDALELDAGLISYLHEERQELVLLAYRGLTPDFAREMKATPRLKVGQGIMGRVAQSGSAMVLEQLPEDARPLFPSVARSGFQLYVGVPLKVKNRVVGVITAFSRIKREFDPEDVQMLLGLGNMVGMAIANAHLFQTVELGKKEWEQTYDAMNDGVAFLDLDYRILRANRALANKAGTTPQALVGQPCYWVMHGTEAPPPYCPVPDCLGKRAPCEAVFLEPHLGDRWLHVRVDPVLGPEGEVLSVVQSVRDVTKEKLQQERLERLHKFSEMLSCSLDLGSVMDRALDGVVSCFGPDTVTTGIALLDERRQRINVVATRGPHREVPMDMSFSISDFPPELSDLVLKERHPWLLRDTSEIPRVVRDIAEPVGFCTFAVLPLVAGDRVTGVIFIASKEPGTLDTETLAFVETYARGVALALENARLFTQTDAALRRRMAELESIIASMAEGLIVVDVQKTVVYFNPAAERLLGLKAADVVGQPVQVYYDLLATRLVEPKDCGAVLVNLLGKGADERKFQFILQMPERREIEGEFFVVEKKGKHLGTGAVLRDVTREREVDRMKTEFISIASHELRTPMTGVYGFAELLLMTGKELTGEHRQWLETIHQESKRLNDIVNDLLNVSRIESGGLTLKLEAVALGPLVADIFGKFTLSHPTRQFFVDMSEDFPAVRADRDKLHQVLLNLVDNAVKYSPQGGPVEVKTRLDEAEGRAIISVSDRGLGIPEEEIPRLFTRFHRVQRPETTGLRGTGLGLHIAKSLMELMGGQIWVESKVNEGSTFYVSLPVGQANVKGENDLGLGGGECEDDPLR
ncbi:MAG: GAF domain-containing protein [Chloroflexota bacterium]